MVIEKSFELTEKCISKKIPIEVFYKYIKYNHCCDNCSINDLKLIELLESSYKGNISSFFEEIKDIDGSRSESSYYENDSVENFSIDVWCKDYQMNVCVIKHQNIDYVFTY